MTAPAAAATAPPKTRLSLAGPQRLGRSLMLPIAALPAAALLLRLGQDDLLGADGLGWDQVAAVVGAAGGALFANLPLLFAVGVAIGMARRPTARPRWPPWSATWSSRASVDADVAVRPGRRPPQGENQELINYGVLGGILIGLIAAVLWQRYYRISLPPLPRLLRRPPLRADHHRGRDDRRRRAARPGLPGVRRRPDRRRQLGRRQPRSSVASSTAPRTGCCIPLGLHHILNSVPWFILGDYTKATARRHGDINRFLAGDPTAGTFMTGFFPIMMFALPAAALAIWQEAKPEAAQGRRRHHDRRSR